MAEGKKEQARGPTSQEYSQLISTIDLLLESFRELRANIRTEWHWRSISVWTRGDSIIPGRGSNEDLDTAGRMWAAFAEQVCTEYFPLGGGRSDVVASI